MSGSQRSEVDQTGLRGHLEGAVESLDWIATALASAQSELESVSVDRDQP